MASPLLQVGKEIPIKVSVTWDYPEKLSILVAKVKEIECPQIREYIDNSNEILRGIGVEIDEESGNDGDDSYCDFDDNDFQMDIVVDEDNA